MDHIASLWFWRGFNLKIILLYSTNSFHIYHLENILVKVNQCYRCTLPTLNNSSFEMWLFANSNRLVLFSYPHLLIVSLLFGPYYVQMTTSRAQHVVHLVKAFMIWNIIIQVWFNKYFDFLKTFTELCRLKDLGSDTTLARTTFNPFPRRKKNILCGTFWILHIWINFQIELLLFTRDTLGTTIDDMWSYTSHIKMIWV